MSRPLALMLTLAVLALAGPALAAPPPGLDARVDGLLSTFGTPGLAVVIVENGRITHAKGYGVRRLGFPERIDKDTIFPTASTGKAFTVAALATLVDEGKIAWDDKVIDRLPGFQMYDPWVTREMTIRDLLVHRSGLGLGAGDLLFVPSSNLSRAESVRRLRYIKPATSFRSGYAYDNVLYMVAGQLIEAVTGQTWETYVREHVLKPAGMLDSTSDDADRFRNPNRAWPHGRLDGPIRGLGTQVALDERNGLGSNAAPAGGLAISAADMGRWLMIQLAHGKLPEGDGRLFSEDASREMWTPQTLQPINPRPASLAESGPQFLSYALGWEVRDWRGHKIIWHAGADIGFGAVVVLIPEKNVGFSILMNAEDGVPTIGLMYELLDYYLGYPKADWPSRLGAYKKIQINAALEALKANTVPTLSGAKPPLALETYAGDYVDPWYGPISLRVEGGRLLIDFKQSPGMVGELEYYQFNTFKAVWRDKQIEPAYLTFSLSPEGKVDRIRLKAVSPLADFSYDYQDLDFTPVTPAG
ncbi:CubicO group peptidase (beta-lactamase class C family) [Caulobacter ginsengisoli]|uniref:CubicO group peptidase (Beta-lactamase class C family) n=1 Tax=Caulobacter ginsengisoli TaxID=400775 RepID=A0ABU0IMN8_9CAUL|nr:serine hydrolase [Caulobacter ginsengisoli]MDQ0462661.1 CubicO group peptidase (beta-lactamase class C family) [Caulobacter ginsengisoli]